MSTIFKLQDELHIVLAIDTLYLLERVILKRIQKYLGLARNSRHDEQ